MRIAPDYYVDISSTFDGEALALGEHRSQWKLYGTTPPAHSRQEADGWRSSGHAMAEAFKRYLSHGLTAGWRLREEGC